MGTERKVRQTSAGECSYCHGSFGKSGMARHLESCARRRVALESAAAAPGAKKVKLFHLVVAGRDRPEYWMHLEVPARATLADLDGFLRDIWLECCGHLSAFTIDGRQYQSTLDDDYREPQDLTMHYAIEKVLSPGMRFVHEYDFGTTTELALRVVSERVGVASGEVVEVMARNLEPEFQCSSCCEAKATQICTQCIYEGSGWLCDKCAEEHGCGEEMLLPVVNSPRMGMCGYCG